MSSPFLIMPTRRVALCLLAAALSTMPHAAQAGMNHDLAGAGTNRPYSVLNDAIPTQWSHLMFSNHLGGQIGLTADVSATSSDLAELGLGTRTPVLLGQIVNIGAQRADRKVYGIYDRLSAVPVPIFLYFDQGGLWQPSVEPYENAAPRTELLATAGPIRASNGRGGGGSVGGATLLVEPSFDDEIGIIPEPRSAVVLVVGAVALLASRGLSRCSGQTRRRLFAR